MTGNIVLKDATVASQKKTGEAIMRLCKTVSDPSPGSEWAAFSADPKAWLHANGYVYLGEDALPDGRIPASVKIVPVYDTETIMHVRVPWKGLIENPPAIPRQEPEYGSVPADRFPVLLARYFMRKCR